MAFGKRGGQQPPAVQPAFAAAAPVTVAEDDEPDMKRGLFSGEHNDDFDIDLGFLQPYGEGKSVIVLILMWMFLGGAGAHRFYLGHNTLGAAMLLVNVVCALSLVVTVILGISSVMKADAGAAPMWGWWFGVFAILGLWYLIDGIYVICRTLSAKAV
ncbi:NINE protein [Anderseniella sp. Alg231-50]|uniref:NINE protein n=1 Tax=Anderseniella sp. Alg231-50 TaxID=1922226 RepID=UPI000D561655